MDARHHAQPVRMLRKTRVAKKPTRKKSGLGEGHIQPGDTIAAMAETPLKEVLIAGQQSGVFQAMRRCHNIVITYAQVRNVAANDTTTKAPRFEKFNLIEGNVLVDEVHAARGRD